MNLENIVEIYIFKKEDENNLTHPYLITDDNDIKLEDVSLDLLFRLLPMLTAIREDKKIKLSYSRSDLYKNKKDYQDLNQKEIDKIKKHFNNNDKIIT